MKIDQCPTDIVMASGMAALAHPARIRILKELAKSPACCCKDVVGRLDLAQSTVSQHLKVLVDAGLVVYSPDKQRSSYSLNADALHDLAASLDGLASACTASLTKICGKQIA
jgi:ArsR family transcriptional regulator, arsenate/arsenite/antimonite-responsive transcriptional repressor